MTSRAFTWTVEALRLAGGALLTANVARERTRTAHHPVPYAEAERLLRESLALSSSLRGQLARWHARARYTEGALVARRAGEGAALRWALEALEAERLVVLRRDVPRVEGPFELPLEPPAPEPEPIVDEPLVGLEFELLDQDGEPFGGAAWVVSGPDGEVRRGRLSSLGYTYLPDVPPGQYTIRFPALEEDEPLEEAEFLDIELVSTEGVPLGGFEYIATFSDGSRWEGVLDDNGRAHLSPVPPGDFDVIFPAIDAAPEDDAPDRDADAHDEDDASDAAPEDDAAEDDTTDPTPGVALHDHEDTGDGDREQAFDGDGAACRPPREPSR